METSTPAHQVTKAYVLLSGGVDSTTCLYLAIKRLGRTNVIAVSFKYGQLHQEEELARADEIVKVAQVSHIIRDIKDLIPSGGLVGLNASGNVPNASYEELTGVSPTYVPFRNGTLLALTAGIAHAALKDSGDLDAEAEIHVGAHAEDSANWAYPDCTPEFMGAMANAIYVGTYGSVRLRVPLQNMEKHEVVSVGYDLGVPYNLTWSCYKDGKFHCGKCPTCIARKQAFLLARVGDPTLYAA